MTEREMIDFLYAVGWTYAEIAEEININRTTVYRLHAGVNDTTNRFSYEKLKKLYSRVKRRKK